MLIRFILQMVFAFLFIDYAVAQTPKYLHPFADSVTGVTIVRITNPGHPICTRPINQCDRSLLRNDGTKKLWGPVSRHHYSSTSAWNADETIMYVTRSSHVFMDGATYEPIFIFNPRGWDDCDQRLYKMLLVWHPQKPDVLAFVETRKGIGTPKRIGLFNIRTRCIEWSHSFYEFRSLTWGTKGKPTEDGLIWPLRGVKYDGTNVGFLANLVPLDEGGYSVWTSKEIELTQFYTAESLAEGKGVGFAVSPLGNYVTISGCIKGHRDSRCSAYIVLTPEGKEIWRELDYHVPGHGDQVVDVDGIEWMVGVAKTSDKNVTGEVVNDVKGHIIKRRYSDGHIVDLMPFWGMHTSCRAHLAPEPLCIVTFASHAGNRWAEFTGSVTLLKIETGETIIASYHNGRLNGYFTEMHGSISPRGTRVVFASNWGNREGEVASYVAALPMLGTEPSGN